MRITLLPSLEGDVIAWQEQFDRREGLFALAAVAGVVYRHRDDQRVWFAGHSEEQLRAAAEAWNAYTEAVAAVPDIMQRVVVDHLRDELTRIGVISVRPDSIWDVLLEQADAGML
jgi:hypothetical protein